jgi:uncharacterized membrane protein YoaK (UPF0700 family)
VYKELKEFEKFLLYLINNKNHIENDELNYYLAKIKFFQHERLIHLLVTLSFALFLLISIISATLFSKLKLLILSFFILLLLFPYIIHYYKLENGVQKLYILYTKLYLKR